MVIGYSKTTIYRKIQTFFSSVRSQKFPNIRAVKIFKFDYGLDQNEDS